MKDQIYWHDFDKVFNDLTATLSCFQMTKNTQMMVNHKILFTTIIKESGLALSTDAGCTDLHGLSDLGFLCSLGRGL